MYNYQVTIQGRHSRWREAGSMAVLRPPAVAGMLARACSSLEKTTSYLKIQNTRSSDADPSACHRMLYYKYTLE